MPDVLPVEADYIAYYILSASPTSPVSSSNLTAPPALETWLSPKPPENPSPCPFHDPNAPGANCRIYEARPLVCRLFGFSSTQTKAGTAVYRLCRHMPTPQGLAERSLSQETLMHTIGAAPPLMGDFAMELLAIDPSSASERKALSEAMPPALARVGSTLRYCPEEPEPNAA
jgi:Fe-S-cluster containining protein